MLKGAALEIGDLNGKCGLPLSSVDAIGGKGTGLTVAFLDGQSEVNGRL